jgi:arsenate reductase (thioredoxin)
MLVQADWVVTVCGHADEHCPLLPDGHRKLRWTQELPATARGNDAEILQQLRASRDTIKHHVLALLADFQ